MKHEIHGKDVEDDLQPSQIAFGVEVVA